MNEAIRRTRLTLDVTTGWRGLRVTLCQDDDGRQIPLGYEQAEVELDEIEAVVDDFEFMLARANLVGELGAAAGDELVRLGGLLFDLVIPPAIKALLRSARGSLVVRVDEGLRHVPWELMHTGVDFVSRQFAFSRIDLVQGVRRELPERRALLLDATRRVLLVTDPCDNLPAAVREGDLLDTGFLERGDIDLARLAGHVDRAALREIFREHDIVHFAGHAEWDGQGGWLLADGRFTAEDVARLAGTRPMPALVFANACSSGGERQGLDGMAAALLDAGVRNYVATLWDIPDDIAILFAIAFYERLSEGETVGEALRRTRQRLAERFGEGTGLWGSYVLYGNPDQVYFPAARRAVADDERLDAATPGRRLVRASPIEPLPMLRGAVAQPAPEGLHEHVVRAQRATAVTLSLMVAVCVALAFGLFWVDHRQAAAIDALQVPAMPDQTASETELVVPAEEIEVAPATVLPLSGKLQAIARVEDRDGIAREVILGGGDPVHVGDPVRLAFEANRDANAYVFHVDGDGAISQVFPSLDGDVGEVSGGLSIALPDNGGWYRLGGSEGPGAFVLALSESPLDTHALGRRVATPVDGLARLPVDLLVERLDDAVERVVVLPVEQRVRNQTSAPSSSEPAADVDVTE